MTWFAMIHLRKGERSSMLKDCIYIYIYIHVFHVRLRCSLLFFFFLESANVEAWNGLEVVVKSHHPKWISKSRTMWNLLPFLVGLGSRRRWHAKWVPHCQRGNNFQVITCHVYIILNERRTELWTPWLRMLGTLWVEMSLHFVNS